MAKKICLLSDLHLSINPRVWKEAFVYEAMGYEVVILTQWVSDYFLERDEALLKGHRIVYKAYLDLRPGAGSELRRFFYRARRRLGGELKRRFGISMAWSVTYAPGRLFRAALAERADLYSAHVEAGFLAGKRLIEAGRKVGFDLEDWYSRDYLVPERAVELLHQAEGFALKHGVFFFTTSNAMAARLNEVWKMQRQITVIYNSFPGAMSPVPETDSQSDTDIFRILWTSRTIGPKRGLETLFEALAAVQRPIEVHLIGKLAEGYEADLQNVKQKLGQHRLEVVEFLPHAELASRIPFFDMGLALEYNFPDNKDLTISNKILQYLQSGIMILCTNTSGQMEVANSPSVTAYPVPVGNPEVWAEQIEKARSERVQFDRHKQRQAYEDYYSWERQEAKIRETISQVCPLQ